MTVAERPLDPAEFPGAPAENLQPGSMVFPRTRGPVDLRHLSQWWAWTPGACWRHPEGPALDSTAATTIRSSTSPTRTPRPTRHGPAAPADRGRVGAAPRAAGSTARHTSGATSPSRDGERLANYWHGDFPWRAEPGYGTTAPVGSFPPNGHGLFDMAGNVWEWTERLVRRQRAASLDPAQPQFAVPRKVVKGGSFLCADSYCLRYRPAARRPQMIDTGMSHIGFRCAR